MTKTLSHLIVYTAFAATSLLLGCKNDSEKELDKLQEEQIIQSKEHLSGALVKALQAKDANLVNRLLFAGANPNTTDPQGNTVLQLACSTGDAGLVDIILGYAPDVNQATKTKQTALYTAIAARQADLVEKLIKAGAQHQTEDAKGYSPLAWACFLGHGDMVNKLLEMGADPNQKVTPGREPVCVALEQNHSDIFSKLLQNKADISATTTKKKPLVSQIITTNAVSFMQAILSIPDMLSGPVLEIAAKELSTAITMGHEEMVKALLEAGIRPADKQESLIKQAVKTTNVSIAAAVVNASKDLDPEDPWVKAALMLTERHKLIQDGVLSKKASAAGKDESPHWGNIMRQALIEAIEHNDVPLVQRLLEAGASPHACGHEGSAVIYAINQDNEEILQLLYDAGAPLDERNKPHALGEAAKLNAVKCVEFMLSAGIPPDACAPQDENQTPLRRAIENKSIDVATLLIDSGADINNVYEGALPIAFSVVDIQSVPLLELMLRMGLHPDTYAYETGETLLMRAASCAQPAILELLISSGANPHETNSVGSTPAMYAAEANNLENLQLLQSKGCNLLQKNQLGFDAGRFVYDNLDPDDETSAARQLYNYMLKVGAIRRGRYPYGRYARNKRATLDSQDPARAKRNDMRMQSNRQGSATP